MFATGNYDGGINVWTPSETQEETSEKARIKPNSTRAGEQMSGGSKDSV